MGKAKHQYYCNKYFYEGLRMHQLLKNPENKGLSYAEIARKNNIKTTPTMIKNRFDTINDIDNPGKILEIKVDRLVRNTTGQVRNYIPINEDLKNIAFELLDSGLDADYISKNIDVILLRRNLKMENNNLVKVEEKMDKVVNIAIDNGNSEIKVCFGEDKTFKFESKISSKWNEYEVFDNNAVKINDSEYFIIANPFDNFIKSEKKAKASKKPIFAFAIAKALEELNIVEDVVSVNVCMLNPVSENDDFEAIKEQVKELDSSVLRYKTKEKKVWKDVMVNISDVSIIAEGIASYMALDDVSKNICLIDVGSKTTNYVMGRDGNIMDAGTINLGTDNYFRAMAGINKKDEDTVKEMINTGEIEHNAEEFGKVIMNILNEVSKVAQGFSKSNRIIMSGGGISLADELGIELGVEIVSYMDNPQFTNVKGAYIYLDAIMQGDE